MVRNNEVREFNSDKTYKSQKKCTIKPTTNPEKFTKNLFQLIYNLKKCLIKIYMMCIILRIII